jgi:putative endonuclease
MYFVYIIYSCSLNKYYVGNSQNVELRLEQHNSGKGVFTRKGIPWILKHKEACFSRIEAVHLELKIKKRGAKRYLQE